MNMRHGVSALAAACLLALPGCTSGEDPGNPEDAEPTVRTEIACTTQPETEEGLTVAGQVLCLGTAATVPVLDGQTTGVVEVAVTEVRRLPEAERVKFDESPFYGSRYPSSEWDVALVHYTVRVVSEEDEGAFTGSAPVLDVAWSGLQPWAEEVESPIGVGPAGCRSADHARGQAAGTEVTGCEWAFVRAGEVEGARFWNRSAGYHPEQGGDHVYWQD